MSGQGDENTIAKLKVPQRDSTGRRLSNRSPLMCLSSAEGELVKPSSQFEFGSPVEEVKSIDSRSFLNKLQGRDTMPLSAGFVDAKRSDNTIYFGQNDNNDIEQTAVITDAPIQVASSSTGFSGPIWDQGTKAAFLQRRDVTQYFDRTEVMEETMAITGSIRYGVDKESMQKHGWSVTQGSMTQHFDRTEVMEETRAITGSIRYGENVDKMKQGWSVTHGEGRSGITSDMGKVNFNSDDMETTKVFTGHIVNTQAKIDRTVLLSNEDMEETGVLENHSPVKPTDTTGFLNKLRGGNSATTCLGGASKSGELERSLNLNFELKRSNSDDVEQTEIISSMPIQVAEPKANTYSTSGLREERVSKRSEEIEKIVEPSLTWSKEITEHFDGCGMEETKAITGCIRYGENPDETQRLSIQSLKNLGNSTNMEIPNVDSDSLEETKAVTFSMASMQTTIDNTVFNEKMEETKMLTDMITNVQGKVNKTEQAIESMEETKALTGNVSRVGKDINKTVLPSDSIVETKMLTGHVSRTGNDVNRTELPNDSMEETKISTGHVSRIGKDINKTVLQNESIVETKMLTGHVLGIGKDINKTELPNDSMEETKMLTGHVSRIGKDIDKMAISGTSDRDDTRTLVNSAVKGRKEDDTVQLVMANFISKSFETRDLQENELENMLHDIDEKLKNKDSELSAKDGNTEVKVKNSDVSVKVTDANVDNKAAETDLEKIEGKMEIQFSNETTGALCRNNSDPCSTTKSTDRRRSTIRLSTAAKSLGMRVESEPIEMETELLPGSISLVNVKEKAADDVSLAQTNVGVLPCGVTEDQPMEMGGSVVEKQGETILGQVAMEEGGDRGRDQNGQKNSSLLALSELGKELDITLCVYHLSTVLICFVIIV